jgi:late competence protein required for DNA uptake (superfamily II DNA/RNA helicase)
MLQAGGDKLTELRHRMPNAGGLVIAHSIEMAEYMVELLERLEGERPMLVHSQMPNSNSKIKAFRNTTKRWLVSVAMVSEGVDNNALFSYLGTNIDKFNLDIRLRVLGVAAGLSLP